MNALRRTLVVVALATSVPAWSDEEAPSTPQLLVARAELPDPNFREAVVLLTREGPGGAAGVIVNRSTNVTLARALPDFKRLAGRDDKLFFGGPVARNALTFIYHATFAYAGTREIAPGVRFASDMELLRVLLDRDPPTEGVRVFAGLAGWGPGQLEAEIERGDWRRVPVDARSLLDTKPEALWPELYRRAFATMARGGPGIYAGLIDPNPRMEPDQRSGLRRAGSPR